MAPDRPLHGATRVVAVNTFVRKHFVHLISLVALASFFAPGAAQAVRAHRLGPGLDASGVALFLMMLSAAIQCSTSALRRLLSRPRGLLVCLLQYFLVLPIACWALGHLCVPLLGKDLGEPIQLGLYLVVLMPVAATASIWVRDARGDVELLVSLVAITMAIGTLTAPAYLWFMSGFTPSSIVIPHFVILRQLLIGVLAPLVIGLSLNALLGGQMKRAQPYFGFLGNLGLYLAVFLNVGTAAPLLRQLSWQRIGGAILIVLLVNFANFLLGALMARGLGLSRRTRVTCELASGMRSNGTALVVGLASFPAAPLVTVPAAIYIVLQHLVAGLVKARLDAMPILVEREASGPLLLPSEIYRR